MSILEAADIAVCHEISMPLSREAALIRARHKRVSLADCLALAFSRGAGGKLLTAGRQELEPLASEFGIEFIRYP